MTTPLFVTWVLGAIFEVMAVYRPFCTAENCLVACGLVDFDQGSVFSCPAVSKAQDTLLDVFGFSEFRGGQLQAVVAAMHGLDVFIRMSTGGGKTLCMFLPPLSVSSSSVGVIISPLNAIMDEQVLAILMYM